ncbi:hypothetical protein J2W42_005683, partial [Rhizobium tibeticum]|nr:hypothetical protein [Rhizobium tibeticum]
RMSLTAALTVLLSVLVMATFLIRESGGLNITSLP